MSICNSLELTFIHNTLINAVLPTNFPSEQSSFFQTTYEYFYSTGPRTDPLQSPLVTLQDQGCMCFYTDARQLKKKPRWANSGFE